MKHLCYGHLLALDDMLWCPVTHVNLVKTLYKFSEYTKTELGMCVASYIMCVH